MIRLARFLRWLADKCGGESDLDLRARMMGLYRGGSRSVARADIERAIQGALPLAMTADFACHMREFLDGEKEVLVVRFR